MTEDSPRPVAVDRAHLERQIAADVRALGADANRLERVFSRLHHVKNTDLDALRQIVVAEIAGQPLSSSDLRDRLGVTSAAITYLVDRMIDAGHIRRDSDPADRRKVILRYSDHGMQVAQDFFRPLRQHVSDAMGELSDEELVAGHRVMTAMRQAVQSYCGEVSDKADGEGP